MSGIDPVRSQNSSSRQAQSPKPRSQSPIGSQEGSIQAFKGRRGVLEEVNATSHLRHLSTLNVFHNGAQRRQRSTHIICTIGPATKDPLKLVELMKAGMNIARLNFSHGTHEYHQGTISNIRKAVQLYSRQQGLEEFNLAIALDTKGPEIRTGILEGEANKDRAIQRGSEVIVTVDDAFKQKCTEKLIYMDYPNLPRVVKPGHTIYIDDGFIALKVAKVNGNQILCRAENSGNLGSQKGVNLPNSKTDLPAVSEKDKQDLQFGVEQGVDMIFASFIRNRKGVEEIRRVLGEKGKRIKIISKLENPEGVDNVDEIIDASDGIMVARGDMGIEIPPEKVFIAQKMMIAKCNIEGKPVICATQMLESMTYKPRSTRAESADVANAVLDGADCVMLSGESAKGLYPVQCVEHMAAICREAEAMINYNSLYASLSNVGRDPKGEPDTAVAIAAAQLSIASNASAIIVSSKTGFSASYIARFRPKCPIIACCRDPQACRQLQLCRGVIPLFYRKEGIHEASGQGIDIRTAAGIGLGKKFGFIKRGDTVVVMDPWRKNGGHLSLLPIT